MTTLSPESKFGLIHLKMPISIKNDGTYTILNDRIQFHFESIHELPPICELPENIDISDLFPSSTSIPATATAPAPATATATAPAPPPRPRPPKKKKKG